MEVTIINRNFYKYNLDFFSKDSEELYYFLGFVAADGYISNEAIEIGLNEKDIEILKKFRDLIVPDKPLYYKAKTHSFTLKINMTDKIKDIKAFYHMSTNKKLEEMEFPTISPKYLKDFIRGYIDGDGCIDTGKAYRNNTIYIGPRIRILGGYCFLEKMNEEIRNIIPHKTNAISKKGRENIYYVTYNFSTADRILHWLYDKCNICLRRKQERYLQVINKIKMKI